MIIYFSVGKQLTHKHLSGLPTVLLLLHQCCVSRMGHVTVKPANLGGKIINVPHQFVFRITASSKTKPPLIVKSDSVKMFKSLLFS